MHLPHSPIRELQSLSDAFAAMAAQLAAQRESQMTLMAGISHDLRSPLARLRMAVGMLGSADDSEVLRRMEIDIAEMNRLIAAQMELTRAQQAEAATSVDIGALLREVADGAEARLPGSVSLSIHPFHKSLNLRDTVHPEQSIPAPSGCGVEGHQRARGDQRVLKTPARPSTTRPDEASDALLRMSGFKVTAPSLVQPNALHEHTCHALLPAMALHRLIANLVDNAQFHGGGKLLIACRQLRGTLCIGVRDRGPGIAPEQREAIFRPFHRLDPARQRSTGGSGLGLAIARQLAQTHGWKLGVRARTGGGSSFWLLIPLAR
ncbi:MAG: hypothetical protein IPO66_06055 [Rhodanobacteraceae bacterium]|nr:hypothetical protein [Rhodanobacteraceae bacterium]